ncbi:hypothetical protein NDU88_008105 [Pleurodeles waltl]|uniref:Secreted protein n=1 Tax=Pleurodeles waltl TaxID=8319 RepID=A0AAV7PS72_PLEWA|nr:hypothetical protein NDU88_008105 [Pleurodeles waltl]
MQRPAAPLFLALAPGGTPGPRSTFTPRGCWRDFAGSTKRTAIPRATVVSGTGSWWDSRSQEHFHTLGGLAFHRGRNKVHCNALRHRCFRHWLLVGLQVPGTLSHPRDGWPDIVGVTKRTAMARGTVVSATGSWWDSRSQEYFHTTGGVLA